MNKKKIMILSNDHSYTYNLRKEIIKSLLDKDYDVYVVMPYGEKVELLKEMGCKFIDVPFNGRGKNIVEELRLIHAYNKIIKKIKPDTVLSYTIKPNLYGGLICRRHNIPFLPNVTGLGTAIEKEGILKEIVLKIYEIAFKNTACIFFQNEDNKNRLIKYLGNKKNVVLPGSGVNTEKFSLLKYPNDEETNFVFIGRVMKEKGIQEFLEAAKIIRQDHKNVNFHVVGRSDPEHSDIIREYHDLGIIIYHGVLSDVREILPNMHCTILPSYHEGMANTLLESASSGKPVITTTVPGCKETFDESITGLSMEVGNTTSLISTINHFLKLSHSEKKQMGELGREKMKREFDRSIVVKKYINEIEIITH